MFNLIVPTGWQIGVVRIEDLLVGVAISLLVGVLLWPRGVRRALARAIARFYRAISAYLDRSFDHILGLERPGGVDLLRRTASRAGGMARAAFGRLGYENALYT